MDGVGTGIFMLSFGEDPECDKEDDDYNDCAFVHTNSGIHNKAAFLVIAGGTHAGSGISVSGIGITKAERLFYNVLTNRLWDSAQLIDARDMAVLEATAQYLNGNFRPTTCVGSRTPTRRSD